jgi:PEP-CTERM motif
MLFNQVRRAASVIGFATTIFLGTLAGAQAGIIGHGSYLTDTTTGMDWLDLTATQGLSYNTVSASLPAGGWQYASLAQVSGLFTDAGGVGPYDFSGGNGSALVEGAAVTLLTSLLGDTSPFGMPGGAGLTSDLDMSGGGAGPFPHSIALYLDFPPGTDYLLTPYGSAGANISDPTVGSFLERKTAVPEPITLTLFGTGLAGAMSLRRRKKQPA